MLVLPLFVTNYYTPQTDRLLSAELLFRAQKLPKVI